ncbi:S41 family peptidase [uncultured Massilia sp.]|uniref:S41 family peptidase n=1 Tax=uncultured Massilia sp. TaxID=169973 RepID=UPI00258AFEBC|nr:S41 family peptidase [uncultured Massilia sp.]
MPQLFMRTALSLAFLLSTSGTLHAATERDRVVDETLSQLKAQYVHPATYPAIEQHVRKHQEAGDYTSAVSEEEFARLLTAHMQEISHDKHMRLKFQPDVRSLRPSANASTPAKRALERRENYGLQKVEILPGNVGYIDIVKFHDTAEGARETIGAAMGFVAHTDALIIDLRNNRGGGEAMQLLTSYFFKHQFTVMELHYRHDGIYKARTLARIPGKRYLDKPVYLLTSDRTFSAGEAFSYAMKSLKRATLVGATTRGGGNPVTMFPLRRDYLLSVPTGVSVSPVDGGSWEGVGVQPDVAVDEASALDVAHRQALQTLHQRSKDETVRASLEKHIAALERR